MRHDIPANGPGPATPGDLITRRRRGAHGRRQVRSSPRRFVGLGLLGLITAVAGTFTLGAGAAFAYWVAVSHPNAAVASAGTLPTPAGMANAATGSSLAISWTAPGNPKPQYYTVLRCAGTSSCTPAAPIASGGCKGQVDAVACTDTGLDPDTTYTYAIRATYYNWTSTSASFQGTTIAADMTKLVIPCMAVTGPASATANLGPITIELQDADGNPVPAGTGGLTVHLTSNSAGNHEFSTTRNGTPTSTITIAQGSAAATFYYGDEKAGSPAITATAAAVSPATQQETITAAAPSKLAVISPDVSGPASATANLGPITVQLQDAYGNPVHARPGGVTVHLTSNSAGTHDFSATRNGTPKSTVTIAAASQTATFYYGDEKVGMPTITAAATGVSPATQQETITASAPSKLAIVSAAVSGTASATASLGPVTIQLQDAYGNPVHAGPGGVTLHLTSNSTGTHVFSATRNGTPITTVSIAAGSATAIFYYGDETAGSPIITAAATGISPAIQRESITAATSA
jgi:hypothetical protein